MIRKIKTLVHKNHDPDYSKLLDLVGILLENARRKAYVQVNQILIETYWEIGKRIIEFEQEGRKHAEYGENLLVMLSKDLKLRYGRGFSRSNLQYMRLFYLKYQKRQTLSGKLSWSHYVELLTIEDDFKMSFYEHQCVNENWSVRQLKRQIDSMLFERLALSKNKKELLGLSKKGQIIEKGSDIIKNPYVLEFLGLPEDHNLSEKELEQKIINNLQMFLLELGKGFAFIGRQFRITINNTNYYIDLVFYHRILKCFVLIDLKIGKADHIDVGQMNLYLNYFKEEEMSENDNEPIGIILAAEGDNLFMKYALGGISNKLFISKYKLYLPTREELEREIRKII